MKSVPDTSFRYARRMLDGLMVGLLLFVGFPLVAVADDASEPYRVIVERNAFRLVPSPASESGTEGLSQAELPALRLTGMYSQGGQPRVFLVKEKRGAEPERLALSKGETLAGVELLEANAAAGAAHLRVEGVEVLLSFSGQKAEEVAVRVAEEKFVDDHTRAHEEHQRREQQRLDSEAKEAAASR